MTVIEVIAPVLGATVAVAVAMLAGFATVGRTVAENEYVLADARIGKPAPPRVSVLARAGAAGAGELTMSGFTVTPRSKGMPSP